MIEVKGKLNYTHVVVQHSGSDSQSPLRFKSLTSLSVVDPPKLIAITPIVGNHLFFVPPNGTLEITCMREVYQYLDGTFSFEYKFNECLCVGETDGSLEDWIKWNEERIKNVRD